MATETHTVRITKKKFKDSIVAQQCDCVTPYDLIEFPETDFYTAHPMHCCFLAARATLPLPQVIEFLYFCAEKLATISFRFAAILFFS